MAEPDPWNVDFFWAMLTQDPWLEVDMDEQLEEERQRW